MLCDNLLPLLNWHFESSQNFLVDSANLGLHLLMVHTVLLSVLVLFTFFEELAAFLDEFWFTLQINILADRLHTHHNFHEVLGTNRTHTHVKVANLCDFLVNHLKFLGRQLSHLLLSFLLLLGVVGELIHEVFDLWIVQEAVVLHREHQLLALDAVAQVDFVGDLGQFDCLNNLCVLRTGCTQTHQFFLHLEFESGLFLPDCLDFIFFPSDRTIELLLNLALHNFIIFHNTLLEYLVRHHFFD